MDWERAGELLESGYYDGDPDLKAKVIQFRAAGWKRRKPADEALPAELAGYIADQREALRRDGDVAAAEQRLRAFMEEHYLERFERERWFGRARRELLRDLVPA